MTTLDSPSTFEELSRADEPHGEPHGLRGFLASNKLKSILVIGDLAAIFLGYALALLLTGFLGEHGVLDALSVTVAATLAGFWCLRSQGMFLARISAIRIVELTHAIRATFLIGAILLLVDRVVGIDLRVLEVAVASVLALLFLVASRSCYRWWLTNARSRGLYRRRVVVIGTNEDTRRIVDLIGTHHELGITVVGLIGDASTATRLGLSDLWLGEMSDTEKLIQRCNASGVVVSPHDIPSPRLNSLIHEFQRNHMHVFVATGFSGIDARRVRALSLAYEPILYVEAPVLSHMQVLAKRIFDTVSAGVVLLVASPVMLVVAAVIKLGDRGPVFFRQQRVGHDGELFGLLKFRTMVVDAEQQLASLASTNERNGPLFKMESDPRVTRVGRFLRQSSLDELPQLFNVLAGEMSLVGPRPALPSEVDKFPLELRARQRVKPGITGLWQVEARDNPSFEAYRRLDLFYVENWSLILDLMILLGTVEQVAGRLFAALFRRHSIAVPFLDAPGTRPLLREPSVVEPVRDRRNPDVRGRRASDVAPADRHHRSLEQHRRVRQHRERT